MSLSSPGATGSATLDLPADGTAARDVTASVDVAFDQVPPDGTTAVMAARHTPYGSYDLVLSVHPDDVGLQLQRVENSATTTVGDPLTVPITYAAGQVLRLTFSARSIGGTSPRRPN